MLLAASFLGGNPLRAQDAGGAAPAAAPQAGGGEEELIAKLKNLGDAVDPKLIHELADKKTRAAVEGLIAVYEVMHTVYMKREIVRALVQFDGVAEAEHPALQMITDAATLSPDMELRLAAVDALGECTSHGKDFLVLIVNSRADDGTRERALSKHVKLSDASDHKWYKELYKTNSEEKSDKNKKDLPKRPPPKKNDKNKKEDESEPKKPIILNSMRLTAFEVIAQELPADELVEAVKDRTDRIRIAAIQTLDAKNDKRLAEVAGEVFGRVDQHPEVRLAAATALARVNGVKIAEEFIKQGTQVDCPMELRRGLADLLCGFHDEGVNRLLVSELARGKSAGDKLFTLWGLRKIEDEKVGKQLLKLLGDKDDEVQVQAARVMGERKEKEAIPELKKLAKSKNRDVARAALEAMSVLRLGDKAWIDELVAMAKGDDPELRNLALEALGATIDPVWVDVLSKALDDPSWSTRFAALEALERLRTKDAVGAIIARLGKEDGRLGREFSLALFRLTGQPFDDNAEAWASWWAKSKDKFVFPNAAEVAKIRAGEEDWRLRQSTHVKDNQQSPPGKAEFFGIKIYSHRVMFIIDISGSMEEGLLNPYAGNPKATRIEVAKGELLKCVTSLDAGAFFNILTFSSGMEKWSKGSLAAASEKNRNEAKSFIEKLAPFGGTNLYGAIKLAFEDLDVDTIFIMSDGEPSVGLETDPVAIREHVKAWNEHRGIMINTIAIAGQFQILEWLAEDSGGTHVKYE